MTRSAYVLGRLFGLLVSIWAVFTLAFAYIVVTPRTEGMLRAEQIGGTPTDSTFGLYLKWLQWLVTIWDAPIVAPILEHLAFTLAYLVPSVCIAIAAGVGIRVYTVGRERNDLDLVVTAITLFVVSVPVFLLALAMRTTLLAPFFKLFGTVRIYDRSVGPFASRNLLAAVWPVAAMGVFLLAVQLRYAGDVLRESASEPFVKTARAKGAGGWRVGRHIFRTTAIPLVTVLFTDMLGMVVLGIFVVEYIIAIPGVGELTIHAVLSRDLPLLFGLALLTVILGIVVNFLQDIAYLVWDPRVEMRGGQ